MRTLSSLHFIGISIMMFFLLGCGDAGENTDSNEMENTESFIDSVAVFNNIESDDSGDIKKKTFHWDESIGNGSWSMTSLDLEMLPDGQLSFIAPFTTKEKCGKVTLTFHFRDEANNELGTEVLSEEISLNYSASKTYQRQSVIAAQNFNLIHSCVLEWGWDTNHSCQ